MIKTIVDDHDALRRQQRLGFHRVVHVSFLVAVDEYQIEHFRTRQFIDHFKRIALEQFDLVG